MRVVCLAFGLLGLAGCTTPSVPLPPPDLLALSFTSAGGTGLVQVVGKADARHIGVRFYVFDYNTGDGVITQASTSDGSFASMPFMGNDGNSVQIYFDEQDGTRSQEVCTTLQRDVGLLSMECP
jgi:hypothetical protein